MYNKNYQISNRPSELGSSTQKQLNNEHQIQSVSTAGTPSLNQSRQLRVIYKILFIHDFLE